ncbi:MAG: hypothetical protein ACI8TL_001813 [Natronomonas sp.]|jgi:hypothetical protein
MAESNWGALFERANSYDVTTERIRRELAALRESDE